MYFIFLPLPLYLILLPHPPPSLPLPPSQNAYISVTDRQILWGTILRLLQALLPHTSYEIRQEEEWARLYPQDALPSISLEAAEQLH